MTDRSWAQNPWVIATVTAVIGGVVSWYLVAKIHPDKPDLVVSDWQIQQVSTSDWRASGAVVNQGKATATVCFVHWSDQDSALELGRSGEFGLGPRATYGFSIDRISMPGYAELTGPYGASSTTSVVYVQCAQGRFGNSPPVDAPIG